MSACDSDGSDSGSSAALARAALSAVVEHELLCRALLQRRPMQGEAVLRLAAAAGVRVGPAGGLRGELRELLLRWGHCARLLELALTCSPARLALAGRSDPDVLAAHLAASGRRSPLVSVLGRAGLLPSVPPEWLRRHVVDDRALVDALHLGGHTEAVTLDWLERNVSSAAARARAASGLASSAPLGWLSAYVRDRRTLVCILHAHGRLRAAATDAWLVATLPAFGDAFEALHLSGRLRGMAMAEVVALYDRGYRRPEAPPDDLARCLQQRAVGAGVAEAAPLLRALLGVSSEAMYCVLEACGPALAGAGALARGEGGARGALAAMSWMGPAADDAAALISAAAEAVPA